jgi:MFS family permease
MLFIAAQLAIILRLPIPTYVPWAIIAAVGAATVLSFALLPEYFPKEMSARANSALNILHLSGAFVLQYLTGIIVSLWPAEAGHAPAAAYEVAFGVSVVLQVVALLWFLATARLAAAPKFLAPRPTPRDRIDPAARRAAVLNYRGAGLAIAQHIAYAHAQAAHWRHIAMGSAALCVSLMLLAAMGTQSAAVVHVVQTGSIANDHAHHRTGQVKLIIVSVTHAQGHDRP